MLERAPVYSVKKFTFENILFPLAILGMTGSAFRVIQSICTGNVRWLVLIFLFIFFMCKKNFLRLIDGKFGFFLFTYLIWSFLSFFWAAVPLFSFMKCGIYIIVSLTMIRSGIEWVRINDNSRVLDYLMIVAFIALIGGCLGIIDGSGYNGVFFQGYVSGANMFGTFMGLSFPFFLWKSYISPTIAKKIFWSILTFICFYFVILSCSRSSILLVLFTLIGFLVSLNMNKKLFLVLVSVIGIFCLIVIFPSILNNLTDFIQILVLKGAGKDLFQTRSKLWEHALEGAQEGGWFGLGFGMMLEQFELDLSNGLSFILPGMERGNSQFIIIQEIGIVGFILYLLLLTSLIIKLLCLFINTSERSQKVLIGIISGTFFGMIAHSMFEGWWTAPGGQENFFFWMLVGVILGLDNIMKLRKQYRV